MPLLAPRISSFPFRGMPILKFPFWHAPSRSQDLLSPLSGHAYFKFPILACPFSLPGSPHSPFGACPFYISYFGMPLPSPRTTSFPFQGMPILYFLFHILKNSSCKCLTSEACKTSNMRFRGGIRMCICEIFL